MVGSNGPVQKGHAFDLELGFVLKQKSNGDWESIPSQDFDHPTQGNVTIRVSEQGREGKISEGSEPQSFRDFGSKATTDLTRWGLRRFFTLPPTSLYRASIDEVTPRGNPVYIRCYLNKDGTLPASGAICVSQLDYEEGIHIEYLFGSQFLPQWKFIFETILKELRSFEVKGN